VISDCCIAFLGGAVSESMCLWWVAASESGKAGHAAVFSMLYAVAIERGVGEAIHTGWVEASFVAGFGWGTYLAVTIKSWLSRRTEQ